jgi:hypothetical protein
LEISAIQSVYNSIWVISGGPETHRLSGRQSRFCRFQLDQHQMDLLLSVLSNPFSNSIKNLAISPRTFTYYLIEQMEAVRVTREPIVASAD